MCVRKDVSASFLLILLFEEYLTLNICICYDATGIYSTQRLIEAVIFILFLVFTLNVIFFYHCMGYLRRKIKCKIELWIEISLT